MFRTTNTARTAIASNTQPVAMLINMLCDCRDSARACAPLETSAADPSGWLTKLAANRLGGPEVWDDFPVSARLIMCRESLLGAAQFAVPDGMNWRAKNETHDTDRSQHAGGFGQRVRAIARPGRD